MLSQMLTRLLCQVMCRPAMTVMKDSDAWSEQENGGEWRRTAENGGERRRMAENGGEWRRTAETAENGGEWRRMAENGEKPRKRRRTAENGGTKKLWIKTGGGAAFVTPQRTAD
eukprot:s14097_g1.t1